MKYRLADKILFWSPQSIRGIKAASFEEYSLRQPLGYEPVLPESLAIGAVLEMATWLVILSSGYRRMAWTTELESCEITRTPGPGEQLLIDVQLLSRNDDEACFTANATIAGRTAIHISQWRSQLLPLDMHYDADDLRVIFSEIGGQS